MMMTDAEGWIGDESCFMTIDMKSSIYLKMVLGKLSE
jgi:hypothetical protein